MNIILIVLFSIFTFALDANAQCWKRSYGRTAGRPLSSCRQGEEKDGLLCYPLCRDGYYGVGPVCWEKCRDSYSDHGAICWRDAHIYGNGCSGNCREGYKNDGCTCRRDVHSYVKKSYGRTAGKPMICRNDEEQSGGLCYPFCRDEHYGVGPVCWKRCKGDNSFECGAFCAVDEQTCKEKTDMLIADGINLSLYLLFGINEAEADKIPENIFTNFCD